MSAWRTRFTLLGKGIVGASLATGGLCLGVGAYGANSINPKRPRWFTDKFVLTPETLRLPYTQVQITTEDDVKLEGWFIERTVRGERSRNIALCCCPYNQDKSSLLGVARGLWDGGYSVLLFDFRSHAREPTNNTVGHLERRDGDAALDWLIENKPEGSKIGLVGASMGGAVALMLASENRPDVFACATDCAFASLKDVVGVRLDSLFPTTALFGLDSVVPLHRLFLESVCLVNKLWYGYDPAKVGPKTCLEDIQIPLLVVHSENDSVVPVQHGFEIFAGAATPTENKEFFVVKGTEHIGSYFADEQEYTRRILRFLDKYADKTPGSVYMPRSGSDLESSETEESETAVESSNVHVVEKKVKSG